MTLFGNALVILSVFTYRPLKKVQNYFIVSLAAADFTGAFYLHCFHQITLFLAAVAALVMPLHLVKFLSSGRWIFPLPVCQVGVNS